MDDKNMIRNSQHGFTKANHASPTWSPMRKQLPRGWGERSGYCQLQQGFWHCLSWNPHRQNSRSVHWMSGLRTGWTADSGAHYQLLVFIWRAEAGHKVTDTQQNCQHQQQKLLSTSVSALHISTSLLQRAHIQLLAYIVAPLNQTPDLGKTSPEKDPLWTVWDELQQKLLYSSVTCLLPHSNRAKRTLQHWWQYQQNHCQHYTVLWDFHPQ